MDEYNFLADLLNTFRSSNDRIKALALFVVCATPLGGVALLILPWRQKPPISRPPEKKRAIIVISPEVSPGYPEAEKNCSGHITKV